MAIANYYRVFELQPTATQVDIKRRYRQLSFQHHPDQGGSDEKMMLINEAYTVLSNGLLRREYDRRYNSQFIDTSSGSAQASNTAAGYSAHPAQYSDEFYQHRTDQSPKHSSFLLWVGIVGALLFGFIIYQLYDIIQSAADTGGDVPISRTLDSRTRPSPDRGQSYYRETAT